MKSLKIIVTILSLNFIFLTSQAQVEGKVAGPICQCGVGQSTCSSTCTFSDCCICWSPGTQNGACGCYWGVATCRSGKIDASKGVSTDENIFGDVNPDAHITFHFENFKKLISFFNNKNINVEEFQNTINLTSAKYTQTNDNAKISNDDFSTLLTAYSKMITQLDNTQKNELNIFIKSL